MHEGMSFSLLEATAAGARIIASDIPANALVCDGFARLVEVNSIPALMQAMVEEWDRPPSAEETAHQLRVGALYHWREVCAQTEPILLDRGRGRRRDVARALARAAIRGG
jgi:gamma-glutamyl:cysteine ligase YbdK (ATP-grasp superfamily)